MGSQGGKEFGRRPYVSVRKGSKDRYVDEMRSRTEKGEADQLGALGYDVPQSEFKKPYQSPNYQGMEHYKTPENKPTPTTTPTTPTPTPTTPNTGCGNATGVTRFCREGDVVMIKLPWVSASDPIVGVKVIIGQTAINSGLTGGMATIVGGQFISYKPGNAGQAVLVATTKSGKSCTAQVAAKPESECVPPVYWTYPDKLIIISFYTLGDPHNSRPDLWETPILAGIHTFIDKLPVGVAVGLVQIGCNEGYWYEGNYYSNPQEEWYQVRKYPKQILTQADRDDINASVIHYPHYDTELEPSWEIVGSQFELYSNNDDNIHIYVGYDYRTESTAGLESAVAALEADSVKSYAISYGNDNKTSYNGYGGSILCYPPPRTLDDYYFRYQGASIDTAFNAIAAKEGFY